MKKYNDFFEYLNQFEKLSEEDKLLISLHTEIKTYPTNAIFLEAGKKANQVGFINSGIFRYFFNDKLGNEITSTFITENHFVTNLPSFNEFTVCSGTIIAETPCTVILISRENWNLFSNQISSWNSTINKITNKVLLEKTTFQRKLINQDAKSSYLEFVKLYPSIIQRVPLNHIASFLGITHFSLSRIRKQISEE
jgi:CRP-like cAMP-binding protein